jgi:hypothetical protein
MQGNRGKNANHVVQTRETTQKQGMQATALSNRQGEQTAAFPFDIPFPMISQDTGQQGQKHKASQLGMCSRCQQQTDHEQPQSQTKPHAQPPFPGQHTTNQLGVRSRCHQPTSR